MESSNQQLIANLAYDTLKQVNPDSEEIPLFQVTQEAYFRNPQKALEGVKVEDRPVGSGLGIGEALLTPVLLWLGGKLLDLAWDLVKKPIEEELSDPVSRFIRRLFKQLGLFKQPKPVTLPVLTLKQQQQLRQMTLADAEVQQLAAHYSLAPELTIKLVDVMVSKIPTSPR
jgi:hypothetical protein